MPMRLDHGGNPLREPRTDDIKAPHRISAAVGLPTPPSETPPVPGGRASTTFSLDTSMPTTPPTECFPTLPGPATTPTTFHSFPLLPAELRLKIWAFSFLPRTVELHSRRAHYASNAFGDFPCWHSKSRNPAALSVNVEARSAAIDHYRVVLPLEALPGRGEVDFVALTGLKTCERPGDTVRGGDRRLYINLAEDMVVLCSQVAFFRVKQLLEWFRVQDVGRGGRNSGTGLRRLAMPVKVWAIAGPAAQVLKVFGNTVFADIDEFRLFFYDEWVPPEAWTGARCELVAFSPEDDAYRRFLMGRGKQFREGDAWMKVGKRPMEIVEVRFHDEGW